MPSNKKYLAKRSARQAKARKLKLERRNARRPQTTADFVKKFVKDIFELYYKKEQFKKDINKNLEIIKTLKENDPDKYSNISTDELTNVSNDFNDIDSSINELNLVAAKLEDMKGSEESMRVILDSMEKLTAAQEKIANLANKYFDVVTNIGNKIQGYAPINTNVVVEDAGTFEEERTHEDQEIDVEPSDLEPENENK